MEGLNIVELGNVSEETRGVMIIGRSDPGGFHFFIFSDYSSARTRAVSAGDLAANAAAEHLPRAQSSIR